MDELSDADKITVSRARKIERFLSQPFNVAEHVAIAAWGLCNHWRNHHVTFSIPESNGSSIIMAPLPDKYMKSRFSLFYKLLCII